MTGITEHRDLTNNSTPFKSPVDWHVKSPLPSTTVDKDEVDNIDYRFEAARLRSFENWPLSYIKPEQLAAAGLYYIGEGDKVKCFECEVEICRWEEGDDPMEDHKRWSARCPFIQNIPCGNVPIGVDSSTILPSTSRGIDVCGPYDVEYFSGNAKCNELSSESQFPTTAELESLGLGRPKGPIHTEYASYDARLRSFELWPKSLPQTKEQLADAGFYYTGKGDQTLCYHCGGGLNDWESPDDPWEQHAKWFPKCYYLLMVKGQEYVNYVTGQDVTPPSLEETTQVNLPSPIQRVEQPSTYSRENDIESQSPGPSHGSQDSGIESLSSSYGSIKGSIEDLSNVKSPKSVDDATLCKICYDAELGIVFLPCRHMVACVKCAANMTVCPLCRKSVTMMVRAFLS